MRMPRLNQWDIVRVEWTDPCALPEGWHKPSRKDMAVRQCVSVGFVYKVHDDGLTITNSRDAVAGTIGGGVTIPFVNLRAIRKLA